MIIIYNKLHYFFFFFKDLTISKLIIKSNITPEIIIYTTKLSFFFSDHNISLLRMKQI